MSSDHARLFLALDLEAHVLTQLCQAIAVLQPILPKARWCRRDALHVTIKFLGDTPLTRVADISAAVGGIAAQTPPFSFELKGIGGFPTAARPRVV